MIFDRIDKLAARHGVSVWKAAKHAGVSNRVITCGRNGAETAPHNLERLEAAILELSESPELYRPKVRMAEYKQALDDIIAAAERAKGCIE